MDFLAEFVQAYGSQILMTIITAIFGYIGAYAKKAMDTYVTNQVKRDVVNDCVKFVEQIYTDLHGDEKLKQCIAVASERLASQGIISDEVELWTMIEACVQEFNKNFGEK